MAAAVGVHDDCVNKYNELKLAKSSRYIVYKLNDAFTEISIEKVAPPTASWEDFERDLPRDDCRYGVFDFEYEKEGGQRNKLVFILWCPETSAVKHKMIYTSAKDCLRKKLVGIGTGLQATDASEISKAEVLARVDRI